MFWRQLTAVPDVGTRSGASQGKGNGRRHVKRRWCSFLARGGRCDESRQHPATPLGPNSDSAPREPDKKPTGRPVRFVDNDEGYVSWLEAHRDGYVVNCHRHPQPTYLVLHRATCTWINPPKFTNWTTVGYIKVCSTDM
jgi:hypothetical protein